MYPQRACPHPYGSFVANGCDIFLVFKPPDNGKIRRPRSGFIQRFPNVPKQIRVRTHGENCGSWMSNPVFMSLAELHWQHWRCLAGWRGFTASMRSVRVA